MKLLLLWKSLVLGFVFIVLLMVLGTIQDTIGERSGVRSEAFSSVARSWTSEQQLYLPTLIIPYQKIHKEKVWNKEIEKYEVKERISENLLYQPLTKVTGNIQLDTNFLTRGIFEVPVYQAHIELTGLIDLREFQLLKQSSDHRFKQKPFLSVAISDQRGISSTPSLVINEQQLQVSPGSNFKGQSNGFKASIDSDKPELEFSLAFSLKGMSKFKLVPTARDVSISLKSNWPHPSFVGAFLPEQRSISSDGYSAQWQTNYFASAIDDALESCQYDDCEELNATRFGVKQIDPVDHYMKSKRSIKYGALIILLIFVSFILFEVLKRLRLHFIHYFLVGAAMTIFYLLLVAFSEHIGFLLAYLISSSACVLLVGAYMSYMLGARNTLMLTVGMALVYSIMYFIILSEDFAFIAGSILVFFALTMIMMVTRNIDWHQWQNDAIKFAKESNRDD